MNELYQVKDFTLTEGGITARVQLNADHAIFSGHFPGQPVLPGVCMMELVREVAEKKHGAPLRITGGPLIKFLHMVDPRQTSELNVELSLEEKELNLHAEGRLFREATVFVRFRLELSVVPAASAEPRGIS